MEKIIGLLDENYLRSKKNSLSRGRYRKKNVQFCYPVAQRT